MSEITNIIYKINIIKDELNNNEATGNRVDEQIIRNWNYRLEELKEDLIYLLAGKDEI